MFKIFPSPNIFSLSVEEKEDLEICRNDKALKEVFLMEQDYGYAGDSIIFYNDIEEISPLWLKNNVKRIVKEKEISSCK